MICFRCGTPIPEGAPRCPGCSVETGITVRTAMPRPPKADAPGSVPPKATISSGRLAGLLDPGEMVGERYEIRYLLGEGPTGVTYRALDHEVEIEIALKIIGAALLPEADVRDRFVKGLSRLTAVSHPNVVKCFEIGVHSGRAFMALQLCEGLSLRKLHALRVEKGQAFTLADLEPIVAQVVRGLVAIHKRGLVAGSLRPEDIIVLPDAVKVADPAVWRHLPHAQLEAIMATTDSAKYLAPEVKKGAVPDPRADSFSLAVIIQEMLGPVEKVPPPLAEVLHEAQKESPAARMTVEQLADELQAILRTGKRAVAKTPARGVTALPSPAPMPARAPVPKTDRTELPTERTTRISEEELASALDANPDPTRQVHKDELLKLRAQSSGDTQQIAADELMPADDEEPHEDLLLPPTARLDTAFVGTPPKPAGGDKDAAFDDMKTTPMEKIGPWELATEAAPVVVTAPPTPPPPPPAAVKPAAPPPPPPVAAKPVPPPPHQHEDDDLTPLPPPAEYMTPPGGIPRMAPPPPAPEPPARGNGVITAGMPPMPSQPTLRVEAPPPPPMAMPAFGSAIARTQPGLTPAGVVKLIVVLIAATIVALVILWMHQTQEAEAEKQAKEKQIELLRLREQQQPGAPAAVATPAPDAAVTPIALPDEGTSAGCPLGAKRNHAEGHDFCVDAYEYPGGHIVPRTGVSWADAEKLCESRGERLCTRREWLASCATGGQSYPYGNTHEEGRCNVDGTPQASGSFPHCRSAVGTFDMVGNVSEWIAEKMIVGGSALRHDVRTRCDASQKIDPNLGYSDVGFRCCTDAK